MQAVNCPRCGRVFTKVKAPVCPACVKEDDETFERVRELVKENPNLSVGDVAEQAKVSVKRVIQYIRDGRLEVSTGMSGEVGCSQCGRPISKGRFCEKCAVEIKTNILTRPQPEKINATGKMRAGLKDR
jgi:predicted amidophosphoribosyltransferase